MTVTGKESGWAPVFPTASMVCLGNDNRPKNLSNKLFYRPQATESLAMSNPGLDCFFLAIHCILYQRAASQCFLLSSKLAFRSFNNHLQKDTCVCGKYFKSVVCIKKTKQIRFLKLPKVACELPSGLLKSINIVMNHHVQGSFVRKQNLLWVWSEENMIREHRHLVNCNKIKSITHGNL